MRAFFCFFFVFFWVACAQEVSEPDFEKFKADYNLMKKEIGDAKDDIVSVDFKWVEDHTEYLVKMVGTRQTLIGSRSAVTREAARNIDLQPLIDDILFVGKRLVVERNIQMRTLEDLSSQLRLLSQELNRFEQSGFIGNYELYRPSKILWDLSIIEQTLGSSVFVSRVCKDAEGCVVKVATLQQEVSRNQSRAETWKKTANSLNTGDIKAPGVK